MLNELVCRRVKDWVKEKARIQEQERIRKAKEKAEAKRRKKQEEAAARQRKLEEAEAARRLEMEHRQAELEAEVERKKAARKMEMVKQRELAEERRQAARIKRAGAFFTTSPRLLSSSCVGERVSPFLLCCRA